MIANLPLFLCLSYSLAERLLSTEASANAVFGDASGSKNKGKNKNQKDKSKAAASAAGASANAGGNEKRAAKQQRKEGKVPTPYHIRFKEEENKLLREREEREAMEMKEVAEAEGFFEDDLVPSGSKVSKEALLTRRRRVGGMSIDDDSGIDTEAYARTRIPLMSRLLAPTMHTMPADATTRSHQLLLRAGYVRQMASGHYMLLPLAMRVLKKIEAIVDEEMQNAGCQKLDMPIVMPRSIWDETGRWESSGSELYKIKDRNDVDFCLGPTHEEAFTSLVAQEVESYKQLPLRLYQIGRKFRDEGRPRGGLLRCKEFVMKDMYSFDTSYDEAHETYKEFLDVYRRIFARLEIPAVQVEADSGNIGGSLSHEYHVMSSVGEDTLLRCELCGYTANQEKASFAVSPHFDHDAHNRKLKSGPATESMRHDPRSVGLWPTPEDIAKLKEKTRGDSELEKKQKAVDAGVRSTIASIVKRLVPALARKDVPMVANVVKLTFTNKKKKTPSATAELSTASGTVEREDVFGNHVLIFMRADRSLNDKAVNSFFGAQGAEILPAGKAALLLLRYHRFKMKQHADLKAAGKLPPDHDNPFERKATVFHTVDLNRLARIEDEEDADARLNEEMRAVDQRNAKENIDGGLVIMVDSSMASASMDLDHAAYDLSEDNVVQPEDAQQQGQEGQADANAANNNNSSTKLSAEDVAKIQANADNVEQGGGLESGQQMMEGMAENLEHDDVDMSGVNEWELAEMEETEKRHMSGEATDAENEEDSEHEGHLALNPVQADFVLPQAGDRCVQRACNAQGVLGTKKGIEVGHVFYLGTKYSAAMKAHFTKQNGANVPIEMCCFGMGMTRLLSAAIEAEGGCDEDGIVWSEAIAPYAVYVTAIGKPNPKPGVSSVAADPTQVNATFTVPLDANVVSTDKAKKSGGERLELGSMLRVGDPDTPEPAEPPAPKPPVKLPAGVFSAPNPFAKGGHLRKSILKPDGSTVASSSASSSGKPHVSSPESLVDAEGVVSPAWLESNLPPWGEQDNPTHAQYLAGLLSTAVPYLANEVILDDRHSLTPGQRMKDASLVGFPWIIVVGRDMQSSGKVEVQHRRSGVSQLMTVAEVLAFFSGQTPKSKRAEYDPSQAAAEKQRMKQMKELMRMGLSAEDARSAVEDDLRFEPRDDAAVFDYAVDQDTDLIEEDVGRSDAAKDSTLDDDDDETQPSVEDAVKMLGGKAARMARAAEEAAEATEAAKLGGKPPVPFPNASPLHQQHQQGEIADAELVFDDNMSMADAAALGAAHVRETRKFTGVEERGKGVGGRDKEALARRRKAEEDEIDQNEDEWARKVAILRGPRAPPLTTDDVDDLFEQGILREHRLGYIEFVESKVDPMKYPHFAKVLARKNMQRDQELAYERSQNTASKAKLESMVAAVNNMTGNSKSQAQAQVPSASPQDSATHRRMKQSVSGGSYGSSTAPSRFGGVFQKLRRQQEELKSIDRSLLEHPLGLGSMIVEDKEFTRETRAGRMKALRNIPQEVEKMRAERKEEMRKAEEEDK